MAFVNIALPGKDGKPGPTARTTEDAFTELWAERGYGTVNDEGEWVKEPAADTDESKAGAPAITGSKG